MNRVFSGIQPSGELHIGNYAGAISRWLELQKDNDCFFCVVDWHAITVPYDPKELQKRIRETVMLYLACGIDPKKTTVFVQSHVKEHVELAWLLNTITPIAELERMTQFKDKKSQHTKAINAGLLNYPVLQAADILLYKAEKVPVGEDQFQHLELARLIARKFNNAFGETFIEPEIISEDTGARLLALNNPAQKMGKSLGEKSYIALLDSPETIRKKIRTAVTDSGTAVEYNKAKPALKNLLDIYSLVSEQPAPEIAKNYQGKGYAEFKKDLAEAIIKFLSPIQQNFHDLEKNQKVVDQVITDGADKARAIATQTMAEVKEKMGL